MEKLQDKITLSVIVPCFNEINTIHKVIDNIQNSPVDNKEIIIVDDFSNDGSREFLKKVNSQNIKTIFHDKNIGKGGAIKSAKKYINGDYVVIQDADEEYFPEDLEKMLNLDLNSWKEC